MGGLNEFLTHDLGLTLLPNYLTTVLLSFVTFWVTANYGSHALSRMLLGRTYDAYLAKEGRKARILWAGHVTSQLHALVIVPLALKAIASSIENKLDPAWGWDEWGAQTNAVATGYFLWDTYDAIVNFVDISFVLHGVSCLSIYMMSFRPFVLYFGSRCLLWEISTLFLNPRWFSLKILSSVKATLSTRTRKFLEGLELVSTVGVMLSFLAVRIIWGGMVSLHFWTTVLPLYKQGLLPWPYYSIAAGNILLNGLNWLWFSKMVRTALRVFGGKHHTGAMTNGTHGNGVAKEKIKSN